MTRIDVVVDVEGVFEDGFFVEREHMIGGTPAVAVGDYSRSPRQEHGARLRLMGPETARKVAAALLKVADAVEAEPRSTQAKRTDGGDGE
jgi:hypothetical protein